MACRTCSTDWVQIAAAAQREQDPEKFMQLIKQLYDVVNTREDEKEMKCEATRRGESQLAA
jgi:uncharacterized tellurite resistance protein B-like protein